MKHQEKHVIDSLNKILNLQIDAIHELLETRSTNTSNRHITHVSILRRKQMADQLVWLILSHGGKIDKRTNISSTPHHITGEKEALQTNGLNNTNNELKALYRDIIEQDEISADMKATLSKHYEIIYSDLAKIE